ncbi:MAG: PAC2 family protein [Chloroflexota bacterium]
MDEVVELWETPLGTENYMIAGWQQWADAGECSSGLPPYLIEQTGARKIGQLKPDGFYLFQIPGTHHLLRPVVKLHDGYCENMSTRRNDIYYAELGAKGLVIFTGEEPHQNEGRYAEAFFDVVEALNVRRVVSVGGGVWRHALRTGSRHLVRLQPAPAQARAAELCCALFQL